MEGTLCVLEILKDGFVVCLDIEEQSNPTFKVNERNTSLYGEETPLLEITEIYEKPQWKIGMSTDVDLPEVLIQDRRLEDGTVLKTGTLICREFIQADLENFDTVVNGYKFHDGGEVSGETVWTEIYSKKGDK